MAEEREVLASPGDMSERIRVLHVDDDPDVSELTARFLEREDDRFSVETAPDAETALAALDAEVDCVISDYDMPGTDGIELLEAVREGWPALPFLLFTGKGSESVASEAVSAGVTDYLQKGTGTNQYALLANRIRNAVEAQRASQTARERQQRLQRVLETIPSCVVQLDRDGKFLFANDRAQAVLGLERDEVTDRAFNDPEWEIRDLDGDPIPDEELPFRRVLDTGEPVEDYRHTIRWPDGSARVLSVNGAPQFADDGSVARVVFSISDITDRLERERELERYETLVESIDDVAFIVDRELVVQYVNERIYDYLSVPEGTLEEAPVEPLAREYTVDPADGDRFLSALEDCFEEGPDSPKRLELPLDLDEEVVFEYQLSPVVSDGETSAVAVTMRDVTERRERERELEATKERLDTVVSNVPVVLFALDADGVFTLSEGRGLAKLGLEPGEVVGESVYEFYDDNPDVLDAVDRALDGEAVDIVVEAGDLYFETVYEPVTDDDGTVTGAIGVAMDITERRERRLELRREKERSEELVSAVSHDLRNPLNVASGRLELAAEECDSPYLDDVEDALDRIAELIDDLLTLADSGEAVETVEPLALENVAEACWANVATGDAELAVESTATITADRTQVRRLLENLMRNAVEHAGQDPTVRVGTHDEGFYVADDGSGISPDERDMVFRRGYSMTGDGTGFGLAIVHEIVESHEWSISVTESEAGGARFDISDVERLE